MFKDVIQEKYDSLSARFKVIADFILEHTLEASFLTATELARQLKIDPATVVRFSQDLGYDGYRDLSREIKRYVSTELKTRYQRPVLEAQTPEERIEHLAAELSDRVLSLKASSKAMAQAAQEIAQAREVVFTGSGEAFALAQLWTTYFKLIGIPASSLRATPEALGVWVQQAEAGAVLVAFSLGLTSEEAITYAIRTLKTRGVFTMVMAPIPTLSAVIEADLHIVPNAMTPMGYPSWDTLTAAMSLIWQGVIALNPQQAEQHTHKTLEAIHAALTHDGSYTPEDLPALQRLWQKQEEEG